MKPGLRVFFQTHHDGRLSGTLIRRRFSFKAPLAAYGKSEPEVFGQLDDLLTERLLEKGESYEDYQFEDRFETRTVKVDIYPFTWHSKQAILGKTKFPVKVTYGAAELKEGAWLLVVPRFEWILTVEDISIAEDVIREGIGAAFRGAEARALYDFRWEGPEAIRSWVPLKTKPKEESAEDDEDTEHLTALSAVADDLIRVAKRGKLPPIQFDSEAVRPALPLVCAEPRTSLLVVGGPGVGKTTWVFQLAHQLLLLRRQKAKDTLPRIWRTSADRIVAGMVYLGMWQERCLQIIAELSDEADYLYIDHLVDLLRPQPGGLSMGDMFLAPVVGGEISLIAECTPAELERCQRLSPSFVNALHVIRLDEIPAGQVPAVIQQRLDRKSSKMSVTAQGLTELTRLLSVFQPDLLFPGKAHRFLDWMARDEAGPSGSLSALDVDRVFSRFSGLPVALISDAMPAPREHIALELRRAVVGQDAACDAAAAILSRFKSGLNDPERPLGALLFAGPTGVGKTELAKRLAHYLFGHEDRLVRIDCSEYAVPGAAQRLLETGHGVQSLVETVRRQPLAVVLLDEIEKAHPEVLDLLLGVLGEGRLTDDTGRLVDFRMALVLMTSNLGVTLGEPVGFGAGAGDDTSRAIRDHFRPELINRIDRIVAFRRLSPEDVRRIVDLELAKAEQRLGFVRRQLQLQADEEAKGWLATAGYDAKMGARPLKRLIEEQIIAPLATQLASDPALRDRPVRVRLKDGGITVDALPRASRTVGIGGAS